MKEYSTPRPKVFLGHTSLESMVLLISKSTGGGKPEGIMMLTPLVSSSSKAQIKHGLETSNEVTYMPQCIALQPRPNKKDWTDLRLKYSDVRAVAAWKRQLVRVWAGFFPNVKIKRAGSRTKNGRTTAPRNDDSGEICYAVRVCYRELSGHARSAER